MNYLNIEINKLTPIASNLNTLLASYQVYYQNLRSFHWHIRGNHFIQLHKLFEELYTQANETIDDLAERILTLKHKPLGSMKDYLSHTEISEAADQLQDIEMLEVILENHQQLILKIRHTISECSEVGDEWSIDLLSGILGKLEKRSWMIDTILGSHKLNKSMSLAN